MLKEIFKMVLIQCSRQSKHFVCWTKSKRSQWAIDHASASLYTSNALGYFKQVKAGRQKDFSFRLSTRIGFLWF